MSLWFRNTHCRAVAWGTLLAATAGSGQAADIYWQPIVSLTSSYDTNINLTPSFVPSSGNAVYGPKETAVGYFADASSIIGIATPTSETTLRPRLTYNYYPTLNGYDRLEGFLNLNSRYTWRRDSLNILGLYDHRTDQNAEQPSAETNPITPGLGTTTPSTGRIVASTTRDYVVLQPTYSHSISPLSSIGLGGEYQRLSYNDEDTTGHIGFSYYLGRLIFAHTLDQRTKLTLSALGTRYDASRIDANSTGGGGEAQIEHEWSPTLQTNASASYQHIKFTENSPNQLDESTNTWGASIETRYRTQVSSYSVLLGRTISPSAAGGLYAVSQISANFDHDFTQRLSMSSGVRFFRDGVLAGIGSSNSSTRNYLSTFARMQWMITPKFFVAGTYNFVWQKFRVDPGGADASNVSLQFGYKGLPRQR
jgi:hypothetical protein